MRIFHLRLKWPKNPMNSLFLPNEPNEPFKQNELIEPNEPNEPFEQNEIIEPNELGKCI